VPSQISGLDVVGLLNRLVDRQHDDLQQARAEAYQREREVNTEAVQREKEAKAEAYQRSKQPKLKRKRKLPTANSKLSGENNKLTSESKQPWQKPKLRQKLKRYGEKTSPK